MKIRDGYNRLIMLTLAVVLCGFVLEVRAQQFTVERKHVPILIVPDSGVSMVYDDMWPLKHSVKYHGYYFLKLEVHCHRENPSQWWDGAVLVAVSETDGSSRKPKHTIIGFRRVIYAITQMIIQTMTPLFMM